jgi:hypothetical protein
MEEAMFKLEQEEGKLTLSKGDRPWENVISKLDDEMFALRPSEDEPVILEIVAGNLTLTLTVVASDWRCEDGEAGAD